MHLFFIKNCIWYIFPKNMISLKKVVDKWWRLVMDKSGILLLIDRSPPWLRKLVFFLFIGSASDHHLARYSIINNQDWSAEGLNRMQDSSWIKVFYLFLFWMKFLFDDVYFRCCNYCLLVNTYKTANKIQISITNGLLMLTHAFE